MKNSTFFSIFDKENHRVRHPKELLWVWPFRTLYRRDIGNNHRPGCIYEPVYIHVLLLFVVRSDYWIPNLSAVPVLTHIMRGMTLLSGVQRTFFHESTWPVFISFLRLLVTPPTTPEYFRLQCTCTTSSIHSPDRKQNILDQTKRISTQQVQSSSLLLNPSLCMENFFQNYKRCVCVLTSSS